MRKLFVNYVLFLFTKQEKVVVVVVVVVEN